MVLGQRYRILDRLGEGGMANVYRALDEKLGRYVAVKILHDHLRRNPDIRSRFQQEAQAVSTLDHPNIMRIYDFSGPEHEQLWLVAELVSGTTLASMQQDRVNQRFPEITAACIIREICRALEHAHKSGIVHRDIKPENVMVTGDGRLKLMDFGIAKDTQRHRKTQTGMFMGSPSYMSPEQVKGKNIDARSDIFSLGVLFYELLTGRLPFEAASSADVIVKITAGDFVYPRFRTQGLSRECDQLVVRCMQKNPESRFQSATELGNAVDAYLSSQKIFSSALALESYITTGSSPGFEIPSDSAEVKAIDARDIASGDPAAISAKKTKIRTLQPRPIHPDAEIAKSPRRSNANPRKPNPRQMPSAPRQQRANRMQVQPVPASYVPRKSGIDGNQFVVIIALLMTAVMAFMWLVDPSDVRSYLQSKDNVADRSAQPRMTKAPSISPAPAAPSTTTTDSSKPLANAANKFENDTVRTPRKAIAQQKKPSATRMPIQTKTVTGPEVATFQPSASPVVPKSTAPSVNPSPLSTTKMVGGKGRITVVSQPAAEIFIDNKKVGTTIDAQSSSGWIAVNSGKMTISLRRPGYRTFSKQLSVAPDERVNIGPVNLEKIAPRQNLATWSDAPATASRTLTIAANRWPANVTISIPGEAMRVFKQLRIDKAPVAVKVPAGKVHIKVESNGEIKERTVDTSAINGPLTYSVEFSGPRSAGERAP
jgi:serine/threonine protein kinase